MVTVRIALLSDRYPPDAGGLAVSAARLARLLAAAGHAVEIFAAGAPAPGDAPIIHRIPPRKRTDETLSDWFDAVVAAHRAAAFDLLHAYYLSGSGFVAALAGRFLGVPSVVGARGNDLDRDVFDSARAAHILYALQHADAVTANSRELASRVQALANGRTARLVPNGVDAGLFAPAARDEALARALGVEGMPLIGFVGEARAKKGLAHLLLAVRALAARRRLALLLIGGVRKGDDAGTVHVFQKQHPDLPLHVVPHMAGDALPPYYNLLDVLVLPSLHDGLPNALLEAMACGRAVIGSAVGGIPDAIADGANGILVPPGDVEALAEALGILLDDAPRRERLGRAARETVLRDFTPRRELEANLAVYAAVVNRR